MGGWKRSVSNVLGSLSCLMQRLGIDPPEPLVEIFPMELRRVLTPFPQNSFGREYKLRSRLCTHALHHTDS